MRVLLTTDTLGGVWQFSLDLAAGLVAQGVEVHVATLGARLGGDERRRMNRAGATLHESCFKLEWMDDPWCDVERSGDWLMKLQRSIAADVIHFGGYCHATWPWRRPVVVTAHSCVATWWRSVRGEPPPDHLNRYRAMVQQGLASATLIAMPTFAMLRAMEMCYGPLPRSIVIHNGRDLSTLTPRPRPRKPIILSAGRVWDDAKNIALLDSIAPHLPWPIHVAGPVQHPHGTAKILRHVHCMGPLDSTVLAQHLSQAEIYAHPARYEPFGLTILEAAASGCALVLGDIPSLRELWTGCAVFVDPIDPAAWQRAIAHLIDHPGHRRSLADAATRRARCFAASTMAARYLHLYSQIVDRPVSHRLVRPADTLTAGTVSTTPNEG
jgi:glycosyltransferase involved in cell wall biosynthesis